MAYRLPPLNALRAFEAAARHMSFQKAADELHVTPSALSYQIRQLEDFLQTPLFRRLNRAVELTQCGERIAPGISDAFERMHSTMARLRPETPANVLTVSTGPATAAKWLAPRVHRFIEKHPDIELRISATLKLIDFRADEVDVAMRFGGGHYPGLHVESLCDEAVLPLVSPKLLEQFGGAMQPEDLKRVTLLHDDSASFLAGATAWSDWLKKMRIYDVDAARGPRFSHADHALEAAIDGAGVVLGRLFLAMRDIASGRLVAPFDLMLKAQASFYFCCLPEALETPKVAAFRSFIFDEVEADRIATEPFRKSKRLG
ncbi:MAG: transcriptional regulator GcvA [Brucellaceae bacterium]|nr:transcriptional regulator GcvA [Brucellaceae bacterium]